MKVKTAVVENVVPGVEEHLEIQLPALLAVSGVVDELELDGPGAEAVVETQRFDPELERYVWRVAARHAVEPSGAQGRFRVADLIRHPISVARWRSW